MLMIKWANDACSLTLIVYADRPNTASLSDNATTKLARLQTLKENNPVFERRNTQDRQEQWQTRLRMIFAKPSPRIIHWCTAVHHIPNGLVAMISACH
jgi:hypothetical protein